MLVTQNPALLLVDIQDGMDDWSYWGGNRNNPDAEKHAASLLHVWRHQNWPIFHIKHNSTHPQSPLVKGKPGNKIKSLVQPVFGEPIIEKEVNSAFIGTDLQEKLDERGIQELVVVGLTTDHCISTTVRMAGNLGYSTFLVADATAAFDRIGVDGSLFPAAQVHDIQLASLNEEFALVLNTQDILQEFSSRPTL